MAMGCGEPSRENLDSSENLISSPKNVLQALSLDVPWTCAEAADTKKIFYEPSQDVLLAMKFAECVNREKNNQHPQRTCVTVVTHRPNPADPAMLLVGYDPLFFSDSTVDEAAKKLLQLAKFPESVAPESVVVHAATGTYSVRNYLQSIKRTAPLIILLPMKIKGNKLTPELYQAACSRIL
ncbi:hypothetical protein Q5H92_18860 [Hymenobacter sp. M29]|uniref:Uncharacterized protein n=2 Tax=Hymenobacter mellowenesis TaxID=3063995 RepID=A0ABT9AGI6_9BACT|nr:hypothetical protein [Hymenobacter sp. M29]